MRTAKMSNTAHADCQSLIDELENAISSGSAARCLAIHERISDLFMAGSRTYSDEQLALFDDVLVRLSAEIEAEARAKLSRILADTDRALPKLIRSLAFDDAIEVAAPVLSRSPQLSDDDLVENASTKSQDHLLAIAQRIRLSELVTDVLVKRGDSRVLLSVAGNAGASFSLAGFEKLTTTARSDLTLARAMIRRSDVPRQYFLKLIENASASVRAKLEADLPGASATITAAVNDVATTMSQGARKASRRHDKAMRDAQQRFSGQHITEVNVHATAVSQRFERTVVALARLGRFPVELVEKALLDKGADMVLILAKAAGCSWTTTKALLRMYAAKRTLSGDELDRAYATFERLDPRTARLAVSFHQRRAKSPTGTARADAQVSIAQRSIAQASMETEPSVSLAPDDLGVTELSAENV
jgi:uncharacterized protein (DUF2336 family)